MPDCLPDCLTLFGCFHTHEEISAELTGVSVSRLNKVSLFMFYSRPVSLLHSSISLLFFLLVWPVLKLLDTWSFLIPVCDSTWRCDSRHDQDTCTHWVGVHRRTVGPAQKLLWESYTEMHTGYVIRLVCIYMCEYVYVFDMVTLYVIIRSLYLLGFRTGPLNTILLILRESGSLLMSLNSQSTNSSRASLHKRAWV